MSDQPRLPLSEWNMPPGISTRDIPGNQKPRFHAARIESSPRLRRVLDYIQTHPSCSGRDIAVNCDVLNPGGAIAEINAEINRKFMEGRRIVGEYQRQTENGASVYVYQEMPF